jgi:hypothetical protein
VPTPAAPAPPCHPPTQVLLGAAKLVEKRLEAEAAAAAAEAAAEAAAAAAEAGEGAAGHVAEALMRSPLMMAIPAGTPGLGEVSALVRRRARGALPCSLWGLP